MADDRETGTEAELIRRAHIGHEASIQSLGLLNSLGACFGAIGTVGLLALGLGLIPMNQPGTDRDGLPPEIIRFLFLGLSLLELGITLLGAGMGYGLGRLQPWARWTMVALTLLGLLSILFVGAALGMIAPLFGAPILGYSLYLMASARGRMVFSPAYQVIIRDTPQIRYKASPIVTVLLGLLHGSIVLLISLGIVGAVAGIVVGIFG